jgi:hypothetical protein
VDAQDTQRKKMKKNELQPSVLNSKIPVPLGISFIFSSLLSFVCDKFSCKGVDSFQHLQGRAHVHMKKMASQFLFRLPFLVLSYQTSAGGNAGDGDGNKFEYLIPCIDAYFLSSAMCSRKKNFFREEAELRSQCCRKVQQKRQVHQF